MLLSAQKLKQTVENRKSIKLCSDPLCLPQALSILYLLDMRCPYDGKRKDANTKHNPARC